MGTKMSDKELLAELKRRGLALVLLGGKDDAEEETEETEEEETEEESEEESEEETEEESEEESEEEAEEESEEEAEEEEEEKPKAKPKAKPAAAKPGKKPATEAEVEPDDSEGENDWAAFHIENLGLSKVVKTKLEKAGFETIGAVQVGLKKPKGFAEKTKLLEAEIKKIQTALKDLEA